MPLTIVRQESANRFQEAQSFLSAIKTVETELGTRTTVELNTQKGLLLVLLYGAFEYSITRTIVETSAVLNSRKVNYQHVHTLLYSLALDPQLTSISMVSRDNKWQRRMDLFQKQISAEPAIFNGAAVLPDMENIWADTIRKTFQIFGIVRPALYDVRVKQYIDEVVEKRNAVAHGRESAATVGQAYTGARLQILIDEANMQIQYMFSAFENLILTKGFIAPDYHSSY